MGDNAVENQQFVHAEEVSNIINNYEVIMNY